MGVLAAGRNPHRLAGDMGRRDANASADSGAYGPEDWSGAKSNWGAAATSLSIAGGLIRLEDLEKGQINHALAMAIPTAWRGLCLPRRADRRVVHRTAALPEGAHLRLDPKSRSRLAAPSQVDVDDGRSGAALRDLRREPIRERGLLRAGPDPYRDQPTTARTATTKANPRRRSSKPSPGAIYNYSKWNYTAPREREDYRQPWWCLTFLSLIFPEPFVQLL